MVVFWQIRLCSGKMVVFGQNSSFGKKSLISGKVVVLGSGGCIRVRLLYSGEVVVFGQSATIAATIGMPLRANGEREVKKSYLE